MAVRSFIRRLKRQKDLDWLSKPSFLLGIALPFYSFRRVFSAVPISVMHEQYNSKTTESQALFSEFFWKNDRKRQLWRHSARPVNAEPLSRMPS